MDHTRSTGRGEAEPAPPKVFISYRRREGGDAGAARSLHDALVAHLGQDKVFFDVSDIRTGQDFERVIIPRLCDSDAVLAVIGPHWLEFISQHASPGRDPQDDWVRRELEAARRHQPRIPVLPLLVEGAELPERYRLPKSLRFLAKSHARTLRHDSWEAGVRDLVAELPSIIRELAQEQVESPPTPPPSEAAYWPPPDSHFVQVAKRLSQGKLVVYLGPGVNASDRNGSWSADGYSLPSADELARHLAECVRQEVEIELPDGSRLSEVSELLMVAEGDRTVYKQLMAVLYPPRPTSVHRWLARLPNRLKQLGFDHPYQVILTTNYDDALEQAFEDEAEDYHLAVYHTTGTNAGKFLHVPYGSIAGRPIHDVNAKESRFKISDELTLTDGSVIVKIQGSLRWPPMEGNDPTAGELKPDYILTEDQHLTFLKQLPDAKGVPQDIREVLTCPRLFLGYPITDWSTRVLLHSLWAEVPMSPHSWVIYGSPFGDAGRWQLEGQLWKAFGAAELHSMRLGEYCAKVDQALEARARSSAPV